MNSRPALPRPRARSSFWTVLSRDAALARFQAAIPHARLGPEIVPLALALGRVLAEDIASPIDVPPFDRALVDGFALRAADTRGASEAEPRRLVLNREILACGTAPTGAVGSGTATPIATGGMMPRGADAVVMIEVDRVRGRRRRDGDRRRRVSRAGAVRRLCRRRHGARRDGAAARHCRHRPRDRHAGRLRSRRGRGRAPTARRRPLDRRRTGRRRASRCRRPASTIRTAPSSRRPSRENGGEPVPFGIVPDDEDALEAAIRSALADCDLVVLSGGTSKGAGDVSHRILSRLGAAGNPGPRRRAEARQAALPRGSPRARRSWCCPGFPTSAMFTFHEFVVPLVRALAGLPPREEASIEALLPQRVSSELGRTEFVMAALAQGRTGPWRCRCPRAPARSRPSRRPTASSLSPPSGPGLEAGERVRRDPPRRGGAAARPHHRRQPLRRARPRGRAPRRTRSCVRARSGSARPGGSPR